MGTKEMLRDFSMELLMGESKFFDKKCRVAN